jgi:hypothetical protein
VQQQHNSTATSILTTKHGYHSLNAQRLSERTVYSVRYYPRFHITAVGFGTYYSRKRGHACVRYCASHCTTTTAKTFSLHLYSVVGYKTTKRNRKCKARSLSRFQTLRPSHSPERKIPLKTGISTTVLYMTPHSPLLPVVFTLPYPI